MTRHPGSRYLVQFWWHDLANQASQALGIAPDLDAKVDSPMGRRTVREGLSFPGADLFVNGRDGQGRPRLATITVEVPAATHNKPSNTAKSLEAPVLASD